jgi:hypothetical protein
MSDSRIITRTALLLAITLIFQSLRFFIPLPPFLSSFIVGSLVNTSLLVAAEKAGLWPALMIAIIAPVVAYFQQMLPLPIFIIPVALGNAVYIVLFSVCLARSRIVSVAVAALGKAGLLYVVFAWLFTFVAIPPKLAAGIMLTMSWPQIVTGVMGGLLSYLTARRIR